MRQVLGYLEITRNPALDNESFLFKFSTCPEQNKMFLVDDLVASF